MASNVVFQLHPIWPNESFSQRINTLMDTCDDRDSLFFIMMSNNYTINLIDNSYTIKGLFFSFQKKEKESVEITTIESELIKKLVIFDSLITGISIE